MSGRRPCRPSWWRYEVRRGLNRRQRGEEGFGLIEVMVAFFVLILAILPVSYLLANVDGQSDTARQQVTATGVAEQWVEILSNEGPPVGSNNQPEVGISLSEPASTLSSTTYLTTAQFSWDSASGASANPCQSSSVPLLDLTVSVAWGSGTRDSGTAYDSAVLDFPPSGVQPDGFLAVDVVGSTAADASGNSEATRIAAMNVAVTPTAGGSTVTLNPNSTGCAFFEVSPGTYSVTTTQGSGPGTSYTCNSTAPQSNSTGSVTVDQALITNLTEMCDEGTTVDLSYPSTTALEDGISCPNTTTVECLTAGETSGSSTSSLVPAGAISSLTTSAGWETSVAISGLTKINAETCTGSSTNVCIAVGYGSSDGAVAFSTSTAPSTWTATQLNGSGSLPTVAEPITALACPTTAECYAIATPAGGATGTAYILQAAVTSTSVTWSKASYTTTLTSLTSLVCAGSVSCFALGTTSSSASVLMGVGNPGTPSAWANITPTLTQLISLVLQGLGLGSSTVNQITCVGTSYCLLDGTAVQSILGTVLSWSLYVVPSTTTANLTSFLGVNLPSSLTLLSSFSDMTCYGTSICLVVLNTVSGVPYILYTAASSASLLHWYATTTVPSATRTVSAITCTGATPQCFALGASSSGTQELLNMATSYSWSANTGLPSGVTPANYGGLTCTSSGCFTFGATSSAAFIFSLNSTSGTPAWTADTLPNATLTTTLFVSGLSCWGTTPSCEATGASQVSGELLSWSSSTTTWTASASALSLSGLYQAGLSIGISNSALQPATNEIWGPSALGAADPTSVGPLYPFSSYGIGATDCAAGDPYWTDANVSTGPGQTASTYVPMGLLSIEATTSSGTPLAGASVSIALDNGTGGDPSCTLDTTTLNSGGLVPSSWTLATSGSTSQSGLDGDVRTAVMYEAYTVTVTSSSGTHASNVLLVNPTEVDDITTSAITYLPNSVTVAD